jgi:hypothetical protein
VCALLLAGCGSLKVEPPALTASERTACTALVKALPDHVNDQNARSLSGTAVAAWGDPAIVLRCGVDKPKGFTKVAQCQTANGMDWFVPNSASNDPGANVVMTAVGRVPLVQVTVPAQYRPEGLPATMIDLAKAIRAHTKVVSHCQ